MPRQEGRQVQNGVGGGRAGTEGPPVEPPPRPGLGTRGHYWSRPAAPGLRPLRRRCPGAVPASLRAPAGLAPHSPRSPAPLPRRDSPTRPGRCTPGCRIGRGKDRPRLLRGAQGTTGARLGLQAPVRACASLCEDRGRVSPPGGQRWKCPLALGALPTWWHLRPGEAQRVGLRCPPQETGKSSSTGERF